MQADRRSFLALAGSGAVLVACRKDDDDDDVGAVEDLMREHGVIRRALVVFREVASRVRAGHAVPLDPITKTAKLIRSFGEDYHERQLEEAHIFPAVKAAGGAAAALVDVLVEQHQRGREAIDYVMNLTSMPSGDELPKTLEAFARMYEYHAAVEDTVLFPAWKKTMGKHALHEKGEAFEAIEKKTFGKDGFDDAVAQILGVESALGLGLAQLTAPKR